MNINKPVTTQLDYFCVCDEGYQVAIDSHSCDDVNECGEMNGGCDL